MTLDTTSEILALLKQAQELTSLSPGQGYDSIGTRLSQIIKQPRSFNESELILHELEQNYSGSINEIIKISINSETELELFYGQKLLKDNPENLFSALMDGYTYDWHKNRALIENSMIPKYLDTPRILMISNSGIPHSALSLNQVRDCNITWADPYEETRDLGKHLLATLKNEGIKEAKNIEIISFNPLTFLSDIKGKEFDFAFLYDTRILNKDLFLTVYNLNIPNIAISLNHGLCRILYNNPDMLDLDPYYSFIKGYYPEHVIDFSTDQAWEMSNAMSYGSIGLFKRKD